MTPDLGGAEFWARFVAASFATWRVTHLLAHEDGPGGFLAKLRAWLGHGFWGRLMDCFYCLSIWVAAMFTPVVTVRFPDAVLIWLALSGAACLLDRGTAPAVHFNHLQPDSEEPPNMQPADK